MRPPNHTQAREHEQKAWSLRCRGWSQERIAAHLGLSQPGVSKILGRVDNRELKRLSESVERIKVEQDGQLGHVIEETLDAWHRSKLPRKRVTSRTSSGSSASEDADGPDEVRTQEAVERDGDASYIYAALHAMDRRRSLWGLDVAPALQDPAASVAELARDLLDRSDAYERRKAETSQAVDSAGNGPAPPARTPALPE